MVTEEGVWRALDRVMDPEVPFSVVELGLVYGVEVDSAEAVRVFLTLTTRGCPLVHRITRDAEEAIKAATGAPRVSVQVVWDPPWNPGMASETVQRHLGWAH